MFFVLQVEPSAYHLTDLSQAYLSLSVKVKKGDGDVQHCTNLTDEHYANRDSINFSQTTEGEPGYPGADAKLSCANSWFHSIFSEIEIKLNGVTVERISDYPFVSYFQTLLGFDNDAKKLALPHLIGWHDDKEGLYDSASNPAHRKRIKNLLLNSKPAHMKGRLCLGVMDTGVLIPNHCPIEIILTKKQPSFALIDTSSTESDPPPDYRIEITEAHLEVRRVGLTPTALKAYEDKLQQGMEFHFTKSVCKTHVQPGGGSDILVDNLFSGDVPKSVLIAFLPNDVYHGNLYKNPYAFLHKNINR